ncbi:MAG: type II secretion system F family protein [Candidatus Kaiserbacteria bacterium]|nr:type II secretion system F family protein [Candidatus Kaiserbacteria bacterium]
MQFTYKVLNKEGKEVKGRVEATSRSNAISLLQENGYTVLEIKEDLGKSFNFNLFLRVKTQDIIVFSRQIATLFEAEISALRAFNLAAENMPNKYFQGILLDIARSVESGVTVEKAFWKHKDVFGEFFIAVVSVGERSGTLPHSFTYIADHLERTSEITSKLRKALTYPIFVVVTFIAVMVLVMVTVIPQISTILTSSGAELPTVTNVVIGISNFMQDNLFTMAIVILFSIASLIFYARTEDGKETIDSVVLTFPLIGPLLQEFYLVRFSGNLGVMLASGVPIVSSLQILSRVMINKVYRDMVQDIASRVRQGATLSTALKGHEYVSRNVVSIIKIGEEAGELKKMVMVINNFYQRKLQDTIDVMIDLIQPTVIVLLGLGVGLLIGSVIIPIYSISSAL